MSVKLVAMSEKYKLDPAGKCLVCEEVSTAVDNLECFLCKGVFHGACQKLGDEEKVGTKSMVNHFNRDSTKKNFKFLCDCCLTKFEIDLASSEKKRLNVVEDNITTIKSELEEIKNLLEEKSKMKPEKSSKDNYSSAADNIWFDKARLESTKVAPGEPMLVLNNAEEVNETVEKAIIDNSIPVTKSFKNNTGGLVVVCDTIDSRDKLQRIMESTTENVEMKPVTRKKPPITMVGLSRQYSKEEILNQLVSQNQHIKQFSTVNNILEHIEIHDVKPTRANQSVFQVFASVSEALRNGIRNYKDKVTIGLMSCKVYDRFHVKRCNNCQGLGHYYKDCSTPQDPCCANCSQKHATNSCTSSEQKCINCSKKGKISNHTAFDPKCPCIVEEVEKKKSLNSQRRMVDHK